MAVTTKDPKASTASGHAPKGGCCGGAATAGANTDAAPGSIQEHYEHVTSSEADASSCCCGTKDSSATDPKSRSAASK